MQTVFDTEKNRAQAAKFIKRLCKQHPAWAEALEREKRTCGDCAYFDNGICGRCPPGDIMHQRRKFDAPPADCWKRRV